MEKNIKRWILISLICTAIVELISGITKDNYAFYMGFTLVYISVTLIVPLIIGALAKVIARGSTRVFIKTVNIVQYISIAIVLFSLLGQLKYYFDTLHN